MGTTFSVSKLLDLGKRLENDKCAIIFRIIIGKETVDLTTGEYIRQKHWNALKSRPKQKNKNLKRLDRLLAKKIKFLTKQIRAHQHLGFATNISQAANFFSLSKPTFYSFWQEQIQLWKLSKAENTLKTYRSTLNILKEFDPKLNFRDLNYDCIQRFELYLRSVRGNGVGGAFTKQKALKAMINQAILKGHMKKNPYQNFRIKAAAGNREFLSIQEVKTIKNLKIDKKNGFLHRVRDIFLFSCFTGLRYSDTMNLKYKHIKGNPERIEIEILKTNKLLTIPLSTNAGKILIKYTTPTLVDPNDRILPKMANQVINRELKVLMNKAGIDKHISFHCARHTFASNLIESGTNLTYVKELLGHTSIIQTQIYAKSLKADLHLSVRRLSELYQ